MSNELNNEDKKKLSYLRQNAVRRAWKEEQARVSNGLGTRDWTEEEQNQILQKCSVSGYEGHHMKSVFLYPQYAGNPHNIQFLNEDEHINGAHSGNTHNPTNGYYDPNTKIMNQFDDGLGEIPVHKLSRSKKKEANKPAATSFRSRKNEYNFQNGCHKSNCASYGSLKKHVNGQSI